MTSDRALVDRYGRSPSVEQVLNPGLARWRQDDALVAYVRARRAPWGGATWVAAGEPVCPPGDVAEVAAAFEADAERGGADVCWFGVERPFLDALGASGPHGSLVVGAEPVWDPAEWAATYDATRSVRAQVNRARNKGVEAALWDGGPAPLQAVLDEWLARRGLPTLGFMTDPLVLGHLGARRVLAAERGGDVVGYLLLAPVPARDGRFVEWVIQGDRAPNGTGALLIDRAFRLAAEEGAAFVTLGLVPLSTHAPLSDPAPPPLIRAGLAWMRAHAQRFYNFGGLERFKAKFRPGAWEPVYLATSAPRVTPATLYAVADAFSRGRGPVRLAAQALADAVADEVQTATRRLG
ncbi:DUF2156 domain-containing protein [Rubrivirga sp. S365]|uniref:DUF2156 domain-containing protein n=1 Tax=Rubrivirga sp. S365 TaxID=3076080 RepID=UPI0028C7C93A|nr:DUF2156 domain-containing protein [Rubrivirga sp. S365]MDT7857077.1 DUF2156 domain-containing protein [Rubrivirga sp. S365]